MIDERFGYNVRLVRAVMDLEKAFASASESERVKAKRDVEKLFEVWV